MAAKEPLNPLPQHTDELYDGLAEAPLVVSRLKDIPIHLTLCCVAPHSARSSLCLRVAVQVPLPLVMYQMRKAGQGPMAMNAPVNPDSDQQQGAEEEPATDCRM